MASTLDRRRAKAAGSGKRLAFEDARLVEQQPGEIAERIGGALAPDQLAEAGDQGMAGIDLEDALGGFRKLAVLLEEALEMHVEVALVGNEADRAVGEAVGDAHVLYRVAQRKLEERDEARDRAVGLGIRRLLLLGGAELVEIGLAARHRFENVGLVLAERGHPEIIDRIGQQQHLDLARAEAFELRALFRRFRACRR